MNIHHHLVLLFALTAAVPIAACGGGAGEQPGPSTPSPTATGTGPAATPAGTGTGAGGPLTAPPTTAPGAKTRPIVATEMAPALKELGLDVKNLPPLNKVPPDKIRKVMNTFTKALGVKCSHCHDEEDMKKATPKKKIATRMWNELVRGYTLDGTAGGGAIFCDSCHGGKPDWLVRDPGLKELSKWMDENFVSKLKKTNGQPHSCETCHGDPIEGKFLHTWAK